MKNNVLIIMCDQFRYDCINALGNRTIQTPNINRLVNRGVTFLNAYSPCPVCVPARYVIRTGQSPYSMGITSNDVSDENKKNIRNKYLAEKMSELGYRTFGIGKFHTVPHNENIGYEKHIYSEELYEKGCEMQDDYYRFIREKHPEYNHVEQLHGERSEMYYQPQISPFPADLTVENWCSNMAVENIKVQDPRPYFGFVSFVGPHPPLAPPSPYNRMYDPDKMPESILGDLETDHMHEYLPYMNFMTFAEDISSTHEKILKSRYYGEISYIDTCIGKILDTIEKDEDKYNTMIIFTSDHGDHMGDHHSWQKESFFESSCHVPLIVSAPDLLKKNESCDSLVSLEDIYSTVLNYAGYNYSGEGLNLIDVFNGTIRRENLYGLHAYGKYFTAMITNGRYKFIYMSNGGKIQLFDLLEDRYEVNNLSEVYPKIVEKFKNLLIEKFESSIEPKKYIDDAGLIRYEFTQMPRHRIKQMAEWKNITGYTY